MNNISKKKQTDGKKTVYTEKVTPEEKTWDLSDFSQIVELIRNYGEDDIKKELIKSVNSIINTFSGKTNYDFIFLYRATGSIDDYDADSIYNALQTIKSNNIFLILNSTGGHIEPAYLISKCCKEYKKGKFIVIIPRRAKSAATLLALGADEIHMGTLSQIGPIDPQIHNLPALGLSSALECVATLCEKHPKSSSMFAEYLAKTLPINMLGHFERISESAKDYAIRLLQNKDNNLTGIGINLIASKLVYEYKDHGFVIDKDECKSLLTDKIVKINTDEYNLGDKVYIFLEKVNMVYRYVKNKKINLIGSVENITFVDLNNS